MDECYFCGRLLLEEDREREVAEEYKNQEGQKPCGHCYEHMVEMDFKYEEWA